MINNMVYPILKYKGPKKDFKKWELSDASWDFLVDLAIAWRVSWKALAPRHKPPRAKRRRTMDGLWQGAFGMNWWVLKFTELIVFFGGTHNLQSFNISYVTVIYSNFNGVFFFFFSEMVSQGLLRFSSDLLRSVWNYVVLPSRPSGGGGGGKWTPPNAKNWENIIYSRGARWNLVIHRGNLKIRRLMLNGIEWVLRGTFGVFFTQICFESGSKETRWD